MLKKSLTSEQDLLRPRFGFFSYASNFNLIPSAKRIKKPSEAATQSVPRLPKLQMGYTSVDCPYSDPKYNLATHKNKSYKILEVHNKIFKPSGPAKELYSVYPSISQPIQKKTILSQKPKKKNFLVPHSKDLFGKIVYEQVSSMEKPKVETKNEKISTSVFYSSVCHKDLFQCNESVYGDSFILKKGKIVKADEKTRLKERMFKPAGRSKTEVFAKFRYMSDNEFPPKKRRLDYLKLHENNFKPSTLLFSTTSPSIGCNPLNLKKEFIAAKFY